MDKNSNKKVIIAMSGGVDSSVSAWLLLKQKYQVEGVFMKNWEEDDSESYCAAYQDLLDAQKVCDKLGIYLHKINFASEYWEHVFKNFLLEHKRGRTPNPDILCNKEIKFKIFFEFALTELKGNFIATGHYVRTKIIDKEIRLLRGIDTNKDQSYFLYTLRSKKIKKILFPVGELTKTKVRKIAKKLDISVAEKKDSTGICFISPKKFNHFLSRYFPKQIGNIVTISGKKIGQHCGLMYYTLGQRKGLGIGGLKNLNNQAWYVVNKDISTNSLVVAQGINNPYLMSIGAIVKKINWIDGKILEKKIACTVKTRYRQIDIPCFLIPIDNNCIKVMFDYPTSAITPGQSAVFYLLEMCIGGGVIDKPIPLIKI